MQGTLLPAPCPPGKGAREGRLCDKISVHIETLRQDRIRRYTEQLNDRQITNTPVEATSPLEHHVDELLDTLYTMHRLETLADYAVRGMDIMEDADRVLIADNEEMYLRMVEVAATRVPRPRYISPLLPGAPGRIE